MKSESKLDESTRKVARIKMLRAKAAAERRDRELATHRVSASELAELEVHPLADAFPMMPLDQLQRLAASLKRKQEHPVIVCRGVVIDGRNRIAAGKLRNLILRVEYRDDLTDEQIARLIFSLNIERRHIPTKQKVCMADEYYEKYSPVDKSITLDTVSQLFDVSRRSICRYREAKLNGPKPKKPKASFDRIPPDLHDVILALNNLWRLNDTKHGKQVVRRLKARLLEAVAEVLSQPELQPAWVEAHPDRESQE